LGEGRLTCHETFLAFLFFLVFILVNVSLNIEELVTGCAPSPLNDTTTN